MPAISAIVEPFTVAHTVHNPVDHPVARNTRERLLRCFAIPAICVVRALSYLGDENKRCTVCGEPKRDGAERFPCNVITN
jgi:hypothetical protein